MLGALLLTGPVTAQTPASGQPRTGGAVRYGWPAEPNTLNQYFTSAQSPKYFADFSLEGLARGGPDGSYLPILAAEVPTQANGDVSADGTRVTWKLKSDVTWSDGEPFSSQDVVFTYQMIMDPANPVLDRSDYTVMSSVTAPDDHTVVVTYQQLYAPYRLAFPSVLPSHVFNGQTDIAQNPFNRAPTVVTGAFVFNSWASGDTITYDRNPKYREAGKPYLDQVIAKFTPSKDAEVQALAAGDIDAASFLNEANLPQLATMTDVTVDPVPAPAVMQLLVNTSCSSGPQLGDPACPNTVLGDLRVRQAIEMAIDKQALVHGLLAGKVPVAGSLLPVGPYAVNLPPSDFNPDGARQLMDQAGWVVGSDGIRNKGGLRAHVTLHTSAGDILAEETTQVVEGDLQAVGIETETKEVPTLALAGGFASNSPLNRGSFDLAVFGPVEQIDPQSFLNSHYASNQVPDSQLQTGSNLDRIQDPRLDQALAAAGGTLDDAQRQAAYLLASQLIHADEAVIPLYSRLTVDARKTYLQGWRSNVDDYVTWNMQDWWIDQ